MPCRTTHGRPPSVVAGYAYRSCLLSSDCECGRCKPHKLSCERRPLVPCDVCTVESQGDGERELHNEEHDDVGSTQDPCVDSKSLTGGSEEEICPSKCAVPKAQLY